MEADVSGRNAETVYRHKQSGKRVEGGAAELEALEESLKKPKAETPAWGGGIAQVCAQQTQYLHALQHPAEVAQKLDHMKVAQECHQHGCITMWKRWKQLICVGPLGTHNFARSG